MSILDDVEATIAALKADRAYAPPVVYLNGALLNEALGVSTYDPAKAYVVDLDGIREMAVDEGV